VEFNQGNLRTVNVAQAGERTRLVLNLRQPSNYTASLSGKTLLLTLDTASAAAVPSPVAAQGSTAPAAAPGVAAAGPPGPRSPPHERALARAYGLAVTDGQIPWAAWQAREAGHDAAQPWAWVTPCHWQLGRDHIRMLHPLALQLDAADSRALMAAMQPYFEQDGIALTYDAPTLWLAYGEGFRGLPTASLDRVIGQAIDPWLPRSPQAKALCRLQSEMQMLLYTHPVNEARERGGLLPVNSFWLSGTGALPADAGPPPAGLRVVHYLRDAALRADWSAWAEAWRLLDNGECARLLRELDAGQPVTLTLCGERHSQTWHTGKAGFFARFMSQIARQPASRLLEPL